MQDCTAVTCESLDSQDFFEISLLDLESFLFHFSKRVIRKKNSPFFLQKKSEIQHQVSKQKFTFGAGPKTNVTSWSQSRSFFISLSLLDLDFQSFSFHFHYLISISSHFFSFALLEKSEWHFFLIFHFSNVQDLLSQDTGFCWTLMCWSSPADADYSFTGYKRGIKCLWRRFVSWQRSDGQEMGLTFMIFIFMIII